MKMLTKIGLTVSAIGLSVFVAGGLNQKLVVRHYRYPHRHVPEPVRVAVVTDLHSNLLGENQEEIMSLINQEFPDVVFLVGDIVDDELPQAQAEIFLKHIATKYPAYYVTGNHEAYTLQGERIKKRVGELGIHVLEQQSTIFKFKGTQLQITGIDDPNFIATDTALKESMRTHQQGDYVNILLAHRPELIETYATYPFDLVFSGHAHGGQWRVPGLINGLFAPHQGFLPKYAGGDYQINQTKLIVSRGIENQKLPLIPRFYNRPEVLIVDFLPMDAK